MFEGFAQNQYFLQSANCTSDPGLFITVFSAVIFKSKIHVNVF